MSLITCTGMSELFFDGFKGASIQGSVIGVAQCSTLIGALALPVAAIGKGVNWLGKSVSQKAEAIQDSSWKKTALAICGKALQVFGTVAGVSACLASAVGLGLGLGILGMVSSGPIIAITGVALGVLAGGLTAQALKPLNA